MYRFIPWHHDVASGQKILSHLYVYGIKHPMMTVHLQTLTPAGQHCQVPQFSLCIRTSDKILLSFLRSDHSLSEHCLPLSTSQWCLLHPRIDNSIPSQCTRLVKVNWDYQVMEIASYVRAINTILSFLLHIDSDLTSSLPQLASTGSDYQVP